MRRVRMEKDSLTVTKEDLICPGCQQQGILTCGDWLPSKYQGIYVYAYCGKCNDFFNVFEPPELGACNICRKCDGVRYYEIDGESYPSVTSILDFLPMPEALKRWKAVPRNEKKGKRSMVIGTLLHYKISNYYARKFGLPPTPLELHPGFPKPDAEIGEIVNAMFSYFQQFDEEHHPEVYAVEHTIVNKKLGYAGTTDVVCEMDGSKWVLDWKNTGKFYPTMLPKENHNAQLWAYREALLEMGRYKVEKMAIVYLSEQGYALAPSEGDGPRFMEALALYRKGRVMPTPPPPKPTVIDTKRYWCGVFDCEVKNGQVEMSVGDAIKCSECMFMVKGDCGNRKEMP